MNTSTPNAAHLHAQATAYRTLFSNARDARKRDNYLAEGKKADMALIDVPISGAADAVIKLASAIDWLQEDASEHSLRMLESVLAYLKSQCGYQAPKIVKTAPALKQARSAAKLKAPDRIRKPIESSFVEGPFTYHTVDGIVERITRNPNAKVSVDHRKRPTWVNGKLYSSMSDAARSLKVTPNTIKKMAS